MIKRTFLIVLALSLAGCSASKQLNAKMQNSAHRAEVAAMRAERAANMAASAADVAEKAADRAERVSAKCSTCPHCQKAKSAGCMDCTCVTNQPCKCKHDPECKNQ